MPKDNERYLLTLCQVQQLARTRDGLLSIEVQRTGLAIWLETALVRNGITSQKHRACFGQVNEDRLMTGNVSARLDQFKTGTGSISYTGTTTVTNLVTGGTNPLAVNSKLVLSAVAQWWILVALSLIVAGHGWRRWPKGVPKSPGRS